MADTAKQAAIRELLKKKGGPHRKHPAPSGTQIHTPVGGGRRTGGGHRSPPIPPRKPQLGSGARFKQLKDQLGTRGARNPGALAAYIGRRKYGGKRFAQLGAAGRKRHGR